MNKQTAVLTVAGSDSGGGAGIQADLRTFNEFKVYGCSVITAVTAQNPDKVRSVEVLPVGIVKDQLESVLEAFPVSFAKTGMLATGKIIGCVAEMAEKYQLQLIVDPVMVSTSGARLLETSAVRAMQELLFPQASWITPNIPEAELICQCKLNSPDDAVEAAAQLYRQYRCNVVLKSGHAITGNKAVDIVCYQGKLFTLTSPAVTLNGNTAHGTGCTLSAAITAALARGKNWNEALCAAKAFVYGSLCESVSLSNTLSQMYPPSGNYIDQIVCREYFL